MYPSLARIISETAAGHGWVPKYVLPARWSEASTWEDLECWSYSGGMASWSLGRRAFKLPTVTESS